MTGKKEFMISEGIDGEIIIGGIRDFDLMHIFECGQCFRFNKEENDGSYTGTAFGRVINVAFEKTCSCDRLNNRRRICTGRRDGCTGGKLIIRNSSCRDVEKIWIPFFDLGRDYGKIKHDLIKNDENLAGAVEFGCGIRILKQDPWETIISFIISQNNNIPRIKKCIESIADNFGKFAGEYNGQKFNSLPAPEELAKLSIEDLSVCRMGYRAKYLIETAKKITFDGIQHLYSMAGKSLESSAHARIEDTNSGEAGLAPGGAASEEAGSNGARDELADYIMSLSGVGPKVANCILLFSMGQYDRFPIDVWMRRAMAELYDIDETDDTAMQKIAEEEYGEVRGIVQQYIFYYMRNR